ncbi:Rieske (2Fe-2S) protein [Roseomonas sp. OT10]|uniref:Rieske (2Fe-2S) protein n=1 Tax=Roseomonas cutis TaxID=2897332 RepID=UPI001E44988C|nr:Rieske (2Fe-2S) protein [Roseomonas sp. OT10]UFN47517.1 Rieske (2Fe-2S) protein [Roseomonas sp. OT10]
MARHPVAPASALPPGGRLLVEAAGKKIVLFNLRGELFGLLNRCPHQGGELCQGTAIGLVEADPARPGAMRYTREGEILRCPWHGWEFDIRTGLSRAEPGKLRTRTYPVGVEEARPDVASLGATTVPVEEREGQIYVDMP